MERKLKLLVILLALLLLPLGVVAEVAAAAPEPQPDPYSGDLANYEGTWIINGKTEQNTNWTLEIADGKYHMYNEYQDFRGDVIFTPGHEDFGRPDTL